MTRARPKLHQINVVSGNVSASIEFYRRLGVAIPQEAIWHTGTGAHHVHTHDATLGGSVELELDSAAFARAWNSGWRSRPDLAGRVVLGFSLPTREAVDELYAEMTGAGHPGLQPPWDAFWGARYAVVEDPDGLAVGLMSPVYPDKRSRPPEV